MTFLFDFDGTLVDSMPTFANAMIKVLEDYNIDYPDDIIKILTPLGYQGAADYYIKMGVKAPKEEIVSEMQRFALHEYTYNVPAKENVIETLHFLHKKGISLNVLTASPQSVLVPCLKRLGIYELFDNVWSCEDFNTTKADPEIYKMAAGRLGVSVGDIIFVDDNCGACKTGKIAGVNVWGIFDKSSEDYVDEMKGICDRYLYDFKEIGEINVN